MIGCACVISVYLFRTLFRSFQLRTRGPSSHPTQPLSFPHLLSDVASTRASSCNSRSISEWSYSRNARWVFLSGGQRYSQFWSNTFHRKKFYHPEKFHRIPGRWSKQLRVQGYDISAWDLNWLGINNTMNWGTVPPRTPCRISRARKYYPELNFTKIAAFNGCPSRQKSAVNAGLSQACAASWRVVSSIDILQLVTYLHEATNEL